MFHEHGTMQKFFGSEEILALSDRILVMYEGEIVGEFPPTATEEELGVAMTGGGRDRARAA